MQNNFSNTILNIVDLETTGTDIASDRIIEVAAYKVRNYEVIDKFVSLVNPEDILPSSFVLNLTSINLQELKHSPSFHEIAYDLHAFLSDGVFLAHNVRFDYGFLKHQYARIGMGFNPQFCCTVRLSRHLFPEYRKHNLDEIIYRLKLNILHRHRAASDVEALVHFIKMAKILVGEAKLIEEFNRLLQVTN